MDVISYIVSAILMAVTIGFVVMAIRKLVKNDRGWRKMEEDRKAKEMPYFGQDDEGLEKEMYDIYGIDGFKQEKNEKSAFRRGKNTIRVSLSPMRRGVYG